MKSVQFLIVSTFLLTITGCFTPSPLAKLSAANNLKPVVSAVEEFKEKENRVPETLEELVQNTDKKLKLRHDSDVGRVWSISYRPIDESYELEFNHVHYDLTYLDGEEESWSFNPWR
ncbi:MULTISPECIES: hypothetical protein [unclassified Lentimonas]|uniref:hypothetical protein n=1 Tax=unclassified Lentimonas TaxID=2630993 RepID=UPI001320862A|nr:MULTISPECIES: hypothetical protein [unclassified Lentimonas]CAA6692373.1 Unannotated [Lentimonas sp. CC10]CAA6694710.1 Unannotated [Lentimonas sp. CC19]CAA7071455.1 Unannotated [Lentimonas sp. CC11]